MSPLRFSAAALVIAAGLNTLSLGSQLRWRALERLAGPRAWNLHLALITPGWLLFAASLPRLGKAAGPSFEPRPRLGGVLIGLGGWLWLAAAREIGIARVLNGDAFGVVAARRIRSGPYRWLRDPIYDSYALGLAGWALLAGRGAYLALSLESLIVLNVAEARIESKAMTPRRSWWHRPADRRGGCIRDIDRDRKRPGIWGP